MTMKRNVSK